MGDAKPSQAAQISEPSSASSSCYFNPTGSPASSHPKEGWLNILEREKTHRNKSVPQEGLHWAVLPMPLSVIFGAWAMALLHN